MALSFKEKNTLRTAISDYIAKLEEQGISFREKGTLRNQIADALAKLNEQIDLQPETAAQNQKLADLIAGKFNNEEPIVFLKILKEITDEIQAVEPVIEPAVTYIDLKKAPITESAGTKEEKTYDVLDPILESSQLVKDIAAYRSASESDREKLLPGIRKGIRGMATTSDPAKATILADWNATINAPEV